MDTPKAHYRYLITEDNGQTVRLMRFKCEADGTPQLFGGAYLLDMGEPKPYTDNVTVTASGYRMAMSPEAWEQDLFESAFKVIKVFEVKPFLIMPDDIGD